MITTAIDIRKYRDISENIKDEKRINPLISEIEEIYLVKFLGAKMFKDLTIYAESLRSVNKPEANVFFDTILNGCYYNDDTQFHSGIIKATSYLAYSRIILHNQTTVTAFGVQQKISINSEPISDAVLMRLANESKKIGEELLQNTVNYINFYRKSDNIILNNRTKTSRFKSIGR